MKQQNETRADYDLRVTLGRELNREKEAINGTVEYVRNLVNNDRVVMGKIEVIIAHAIEYGKITTAIKRKVAP